MLLWAHAATKLGEQLGATRLLWVAPPGPSAFVEAIATFAPGNLDTDAVAASAPIRQLVSSRDDPYCPEQADRHYGTLGFTSHVLPDAGHIDPDSGCGPWYAVERWALGDLAAFG